MKNFGIDAVNKASERASRFHGADFDGVWDSLPNVRMIAKVIITGRSYEEAITTFKEIKGHNSSEESELRFTSILSKEEYQMLIISQLGKLK